MRYLQSFAETESARRALEISIEQPFVEGVSVATEETWRLLEASRYRLTKSQLDGVEQELAHICWDYQDRGYPWWNFRQLSGRDDLVMRMDALVFEDWQPLIDIKWLPQNWPWAQPGLPGGSIFVVTVTVSPGATQIGDLRNTLEELGRSAEPSFIVRFEAPPRGRLLTNVAPVEVSARLQGGARLWDSSSSAAGTAGASLALGGASTAVATAAHVVQTASAVSYHAQAGGTSVVRNGHVIWRSTLTPAPSLINLSIAQSAADIDFALVNGLDTTRQTWVDGIGPVGVSMPIADLREGQILDTSGAGSGIQRLRMADLVLMRKLYLGATAYLYRDLFRLHRVSRFWGLTGTLRRPARPNDSGGWVVGDGPEGPAWVGVVIGGDGPEAFACFAERALNAARAAGFDVVVNPDPN